MTLKELSCLYFDSARLLDERLCELRQQAHAEENADARRRLERRIEILRQMRSECCRIGRLTAHYYDRKDGRA